MIPFVVPFFDALEDKVLRTQHVPSGIHRDELLQRIYVNFPAGNLVFAKKGEAALAQLLQQITAVAGKPVTTAIGTMMCGSVLRATELGGTVQLMDSNSHWQQMPDAASRRAAVVVFAGLCGKRMAPPERGHSNQILIDDGAQCFDGITGFHPETDYSLFSFGAGKQMFAGGGAILWSARHDLTSIAQSLEYDPPDWQLYLMASQLEKIGAINTQRRENALYLIDRLRCVSWLSLPDPEQHQFLKFTVRIDRGNGALRTTERPVDHVRFVEHMLRSGVEVEDWYVPLHLRFPEVYHDSRYQDFRANELWSEAITLPCRPQLTRADLDKIADAVIAYRSGSLGFVPQSDQCKWSHVYTSSMLGRPQADDYFGRLFNIKSAIVRRLGIGKKILDLGCGTGAHMLPLLADGYDVCGLDFAAPHVETLRRHWIDAAGDPLRLKTLVADIASVPEASGTYDLIYSFSTLYYVPDLDRALDEIARLLCDRGIAVLELGNSNSLADIEARRVLTGVHSFHLTSRAMRGKLARCGLLIRESYVFQIAPLYGGATPQDQEINEKLKVMLAERCADGRMQDEVISSSPILSHFAFRHIFVVEKTNDVNDLAKDIRYQISDINIDDAKNLVARGKELVASGHIIPALDVYVQALVLDPVSVDATFAIGDLYEAPEERRFVARARRLHRRFIRQSARKMQNTEGFFELDREMGGIATTNKAPKNDLLKPRVSIVLPTYNHIAFLPLAIDGILSQTFNDFELIIVNDGSTDDTKTYLATLTDSRIKIIQRENGGLPSALNKGFELATGKYFTWTSADNVTAPTWLEKLVATLDAAPETVGFVCSGYAEIDVNGRLLGFRRGQKIEYDRMVACNAGIASFMYRASIAEQVGEYDITLTGAEDWDMWLRILDVCDGMYVDDILYYYRLHSESMTATMRAKIDAASVAVVHKLYRSHGDSFNLTRFYPRLPLATNQPLATWQAKTRLAAILMGSPFCPAGWAGVLLLDALHDRFSLEVHQNLLLLLCRCNAWDIAVQAVDDFSNFIAPPVSDALRKRLIDRDISILQEFSTFHLPDDSLVFDLGRDGHQNLYDESVEVI
jgi:ubiquinone/menaquinone biosynthesis C-methylase UbiE